MAELTDIINQINSFEFRYSNLTDIQKRDFSKVLKNEGLTYTETYSGVKYQYDIPFLIKGNGIVKDVLQQGPYPIVIKNNDIEIHYEPRDLSLLQEIYRDRVDNAEFRNIIKGENINYSGKVESIEFIKFDVYDTKYILHICGNEISVADKQNEVKAIRNGLLGSLIGAIFGFGLGIAIVIVLALIVLPIYSWSEYGWNSTSEHNYGWYAIIFSTIIGVVFGYYSDYSLVRKLGKK